MIPIQKRGVSNNLHVIHSLFDTPDYNKILVYIEDGVDIEKAKSYIQRELGYRTWELLFESAYAEGYIVS